MNNIVERNTQVTQINNDMFNKWLEYIDIKHNSAETYNRAIHQFMCWLRANEITAPQRADIIAFREDLKRDLKATTIQNYLAAVKQFFKWAAQEGLYENVADNVKGVQVSDTPKKDWLTEAEAALLIKSIDTSSLKGKRDMAIIRLLLTTGLRTVEITRANIEDLTDNRLYIQGKGRDEKAEWVKLTNYTAKAISDYLTARGEADKEQPLFASLSNHNEAQRLTTRSISRIAKERFKAIGLDSERLSAHSLRHTAATIAIKNGATIHETQQLLRHKKIDTTLKYVHALKRENNHSEELIEKAILSA